MHPLTVMTAIVLGSCFAIATSLAAVLVVYLILSDDYPRIQHEFRPLLTSFLLFLGMTLISAASFYSRLISHRLATTLQAFMWVSLAGVAWYYWP